MTPKEKLGTALAALDHARRAIEELEDVITGDGAVDDAVADCSTELEAWVAGLAHLHLECA